MHKKYFDNNIKLLKYFNISKKEKLALFSHFDIHNRIDQYVVEYIKSLHKFGFDIVFVTTSTSLSIFEINKIKKYIHILVIKKNIGYDFAAWQCGLNVIDNYSKYNTILHANDSIIFPLSNPKAFFRKASRYDFFGLTSSIQKGYHIQSFFLVFNKKLINSKLYKNFWKNFNLSLTKQQIIDNYEIGLTKLIQKQNYKVGAFIEHKDIIQLDDNNPYWFAWDIIIDKFNAPFIKKNMLLTNHIEYNEGTQFLKYYVCNKYFKIIQDYIHRYNNSSKNYNLCESFISMDDDYDIYKILEDKLNIIIKGKSKILLYGYGLFGKVLHTLLKDKITTIVDKDFGKKDLGIEETHKKIFYNLENNIDFNEYDLILSTPVGANNETITYLKNKLTNKMSTIVSILDIIDRKKIKDIEIISKAIYKNNYFLPQSNINLVLNYKYINILKFINEYVNFQNLPKKKPLEVNSDKLFFLILQKNGQIIFE